MKTEKNSGWHKFLEAKTIFTAPSCVNSIPPSNSPSISTAYLRSVSDLNDTLNEKHLKDLVLFRYPAIVVASYNGNICTLLTQSFVETDSVISLKEPIHHFRLRICFERNIKSVALLTYKYVTNPKNDHHTFNCEDVILVVHTQCGRLWKSNICSKDRTIHNGTVAFSNGHFNVPHKNPHQHAFQMVECFQNCHQSSRIPLLLGFTHMSLQMNSYEDLNGNDYSKINQNSVHKQSIDTKSSEHAFIAMAVAGGIKSPRIFTFSTKNKYNISTLRDHHNDLHIEAIEVDGLEEHNSRITFLILLFKENMMPALWETICSIWNNSHDIAITNTHSCIQNKFDYNGAIFIGSKDGSVHCSLFFVTTNTVRNVSNENANIDKRINFENCCDTRSTRFHFLFNINDAKSDQTYDDESIISIDFLSSFAANRLFQNDHSYKSSKLLIVGSLGSLYILDPDSSKGNQTTFFRRLPKSLPPIGTWRSVASFSNPCHIPNTNMVVNPEKGKLEHTLLAVLDSGSTFLFSIKLHDSVHKLKSSLNKFTADHNKFLIEQNSLQQLKSSSETAQKLHSLPIRKEMSLVSICATSNPFSNSPILFVVFCTFRGAIILMQIKLNFDLIMKQSKQSTINYKKRKMNLLQLQNMDSKTYKITIDLEKQFKTLQAAVLETRNATRVISKILSSFTCYSKPCNNHISKPNVQTLHLKTNLHNFWRTEMKYTPYQDRSNASVTVQVQSPLFDCIDSAKVLDDSTCLSWNQCCHIFQSISTQQLQVSQMQQLCSRKYKCIPDDSQMIKVVFGGLVQSHSQKYYKHDNVHKNEEIKNAIEITIPLWDKFPSSAIISVQGIYNYDITQNEAWIQCIKETHKHVGKEFISEENNTRHVAKEKQIDVLTSASIKWDPLFIEGQEQVNNRNKELLGFIIPTQSSRKRIWDILADLYPLCNSLSIPNQANKSMSRKSDSSTAYSEIIDFVERHAEHLVQKSSLQESSKVKQYKFPFHLEEIMLSNGGLHRSTDEKASTRSLCVGSLRTSLFHGHDKIFKSSYKKNVVGLDTLALVLSDPVKITSSSKARSNYEQIIGFSFIGDFVEDDMDGICSLIREGILARIINCDNIHEVQVQTAINNYYNSLICPNFEKYTKELLVCIKELQLDRGERNKHKKVHEALQLYRKLRALNILIK